MKYMFSLSPRALAGAGAAFAFLTLGATNAHADRYAAFVIDDRTQEVLHEEAADEARFPASLTKMMTLYLLFDALDRGDVSLSTRMSVSKHASRQAPSKLGLKRGETIRVEDAIKALVTKSANDVAVVIAEKLGGSESRFAAKMTARARELGMTSTKFMNASGLPNGQQRTTARDIATLSRALVHDHTKYYTYFRTPGMSWRSRYARNHNGLLGKVEGVDGIKTGYTNASGFNLASSVERNGHRIFAVVMGGESAAARDAQMAELIEGAYEELARREGATPKASLVSLPVTKLSIETEGPSAAPPTDGAGAGDAPLRTGGVLLQQAPVDTMSYATPAPKDVYAPFPSIEGVKPPS